MGRKWIIFGMVGLLLFGGTTLVSVAKENYDLLIITPDDLEGSFTALVVHKQQYGISSKIVTLSDISSGTFFPTQGRDDPENLKYFIKDAHETWNVSYVILVGGKDRMPVRYVDVTSVQSGGSWHFISDLYYADLYNSTGGFCSWDTDGDNLFGEANDSVLIDDVHLIPDVCVGRLLCSSPSEASVVVNKIIMYESSTVGSSSWFKNLVLTGGDEFPNMFIEYLLPLILRHKGRVACEGIYTSNQIAAVMSGFTAKKFFSSRNIADDAEYLTKENIRDAIDEGAGFVAFTSHGLEDRILTHPPLRKNIWVPRDGGFNSTDVQLLQNQEKLPVVVFNACLCGDFDSIATPIAWEFLRNAQGGGIASLACTCTSDNYPGTLCTETMLGYLTTSFFNQYASGTHILGNVWKESISAYANDREAMRIGAPDISIGDHLLVMKGPCFMNHFVMEEWALFGDPSLMIGGYES
jgi:Peptidase family C25